MTVLWPLLDGSKVGFWVVFRYGELAHTVGVAESCRMFCGFLLGIERKALLVGAKGIIVTATNRYQGQ